MSEAVIVGAGIAGPVAGMALSAAGWSVTVVEAGERGGDAVGAWLTLQANGIDALTAIGAQSAVEGTGFPTRSMRFVTGSGRNLGTIPNGSPVPAGTPSSLVRRSSLYAELRRLAAVRGVQVQEGVPVVGVEADVRGAAVRLADGTRLAADVVIGADGIRSTVRTYLDPDAPQPRYIPVLNVGGEVNDLDLTGYGWPDDQFQMLFGRRCFFGIHPTPTGGAVWFANPPLPAEPSAADRARLRETASRSDLLRLLDHDHGPVAQAVRAAIERADDRSLRPWTTYDVPTTPVWHRGPVAIIGDAAHATAPSAGQGASLALEDAVVIAQCLRDAADPHLAFTAFERIRRERVERIVANGNRGSTTKAAGPLGRIVRDVMLPVIFYALSRNDGAASRWITDHHIDWARPTTLSTPSTAH